MKIINNLKPIKKFDIEELLNFLASELEISEDVELALFYNGKLLDKLSTDDVEYSALLQPYPIPKKYSLMVREDASSLNQILCHEMVHLKQYESGLLSQSSDFKTVTWKGKVYDNTERYFNREWEEEAFDKQNKLWKQFKKQKKNGD